MTKQIKRERRKMEMFVGKVNSGSEISSITRDFHERGNLILNL